MVCSSPVDCQSHNLDGSSNCNLTCIITCLPGDHCCNSSNDWLSGNNYTLYFNAIYLA